MPTQKPGIEFPPVERNRAIFTLVFVILVSWFLTSSEWLVRELQVRLYGLVAPVLDQNNEFRVYAEKLKDEVSHSSELEAELVEVSLELERLKILEKNYLQLEDNRNQLRELLSLKALMPQELIAGEVIGKNPGYWVKSIQINVGDDAGVKIGMPVIGRDGLVGVVALVNGNLSTVRLLTDEASLVSVKLLGTSELGIVSGTRHQFGENGSNLRLQYLPKTVELNAGVKVVTSGKGSVFPEGINVGTVESFSYDLKGAEAVVRSNVDFEKLKYLFVIKQ